MDRFFGKLVTWKAYSNMVISGFMWLRLLWGILGWRWEGVVQSLAQVHEPTRAHKVKRSFVFYSFPTNKTTVYIIFRKEAALNRGPPGREDDRQWEDSNLRHSGANTKTLPACTCQLWCVYGILIRITTNVRSRWYAVMWCKIWVRTNYSETCIYRTQLTQFTSVHIRLQTTALINYLLS